MNEGVIILPPMVAYAKSDFEKAVDLCILDEISQELVRFLSYPLLFSNPDIVESFPNKIFILDFHYPGLLRPIMGCWILQYW